MKLVATNLLAMKLGMMRLLPRTLLVLSEKVMVTFLNNQSFKLFLELKRLRMILLELILRTEWQKIVHQTFLYLSFMPDQQMVRTWSVKTT